MTDHHGDYDCPEFEIDLDAAEKVDPGDVGAVAFPSEDERPCWRVYDDWMEIGNGKKARPGVYRHTMTKGSDKELPAPVNTWICGPVHLEAMTRDGEGTSFGVLLHFVDREGGRRQWAMPYEMMAGNGDEVRRELLSMGLDISSKRRAMLSDYLQHKTPKRKVLCTGRTGWTGSGAFVLPDGVIGPGAGGVVFQDGGRIGKGHGQAGTADSWRDSVSRLAIGNPLSIFGVSCAFAPPLLEATHAEGGGVHFVGGSSSGKTTILEKSRSVWGGPDFKRSWRATSNGVEGVAEQHNDLLLCMDEINEVDPREAGAISYMLTNGVGKSRATRTGASRPPKRWRTFVFSTGEQSLEATMREGRMNAKAGQSIRLLDIRADNRRHGCFDELHGHGSGRAFSDAIKRATKENYGAVGRAFLEKLTHDKRDFGELLEMAKAIPEFAGHSGQEGRAAARFALIGLAGELATEYGLTGWAEKDALKAAVVAFNAWLSFRGVGDQEPRKIREAFRDFIDRHGDSRFVDGDAEKELRDSMERHVRDRAGYRKSTEDGGREYYFNTAAMKEAAPSFDLSTVTEVLKDCGALKPASDGRSQRQARFGGSNGKWYVINRERLES